MSTVRTERADGIANIVLSRPEKLNAIDPTMLDELGRQMASVEADPDVKVVVLSGDGPSFCAGADLDAVDVLLEDTEAWKAFFTRWHEVFDAVASSSRPTIAAVHGLALAGGFELMLACDLVVLADDARIGDQHARFGLFPGGGGTQRLPRQIGMRPALWLLLSGEWMDPQDAVTHGLVNRLAPADGVVDEAMRMAAVLAQRSPAASAAIKRAVRLGAQVGLDAALALEFPAALAHMQSQDARIGIEAFKTRTTPRFVGR